MNKKYTPIDIHNFPQHMATQAFQFGHNNLYPPFTRIMNLPTPSSNIQYINKGTGPPPVLSYVMKY
jgi:hypothetical protein